MSVAEKMTAIADAIREKTGETGKLSLDGMAEALRKLPGPIVATASGNPICLSDATDLKLRGLKLFGRTTQNGTPTPDAPVPLVSAGDGGSLGVTVAGKNLLKNNLVNGSKAGVSWNVEADGGVTITGTANGGNVFVDIPKKEEESIVCNMFAGKVISGETGRTQTTVDGKQATLSEGLAVDGVNHNVYYKINNGATVNKTFYPQIEYGTVSTEYEPYNAQTLTVSTPNGLSGIPVTTGGNYTDEAGQQWVCDEVDFTRGVYVQKIKQTVFDGSADEKWTGSSTGNAPYGATITDIADCTNVDTQIVCDRYPTATINESWSARNYLISRPSANSPTVCFRNVNIASLDAWKADISENPITIQYILATPIETPLSAEELAAYAALRTNYPNTTILNDGGAGMEVQYVADTKLYIDNKINAMAAAIVNA